CSLRALKRSFQQVQFTPGRCCLLLPSRKRDEIFDLACDNRLRLCQAKALVPRTLVLPAPDRSRLASITIQPASETAALRQKHHLNLLIQTERHGGRGQIHITEQDQLPDVRLRHARRRLNLPVAPEAIA